MSERRLLGASASPGLAVGPAFRIGVARALATAEVVSGDRSAEAQRALEALERAAAELTGLACGLRRDGRPEEAEIIETGVLMAQDPQLRASVEAAVAGAGASAGAALVEAADEHADLIATLGDANLAARADDVRSIGRRAAAIAAGASAAIAADVVAAIVAVASDLGPADVIELGGRLAGVVLARGAVTAHAAIVARSLGVPMVVAAGAGVLEFPDGGELVVDGDAGVVFERPSRTRLAAARGAMAQRAAATGRAAAARELPAVTCDGHRVAVLANVAGSAEVGAALRAGADGAGLIRTELPFLQAGAWPTEEEHAAALEPVLRGLSGRVTTVRVLDFGADKTPPFLRGTELRGLELLLETPATLSAQLRAILRVSRSCGCRLRVLLPMVTGPAELLTARLALADAVAQVRGAEWPRLGAMIETPAAATVARELALRADFISVGTNDLTHATLGSDRFAAAEAATHHPRVLALIDRCVRAARATAIPIEICGESASDPVTMPLLVGLGIDELSVGAARVGAVREWVRSLEFRPLEELSRAALELADAAEVAALIAPVARSLQLLERGDTDAERFERRPGVFAVGPQA